MPPSAPFADHGALIAFFHDREADYGEKDIILHDLSAATDRADSMKRSLHSSWSVHTGDREPQRQRKAVLLRDRR